MSPDYEHFDIDLADIWVYEFNRSKVGSETPFSYFYENYLLLQSLFVKLGLKPYLSPESIKTGKHKQDYYEREHIRLVEGRGTHVFRIFERCESLYDMTTPCPVKWNKISKLNYQKLFALKLSQYKEGLLELSGFLEYHFRKTFGKDIATYSEFITLTLDKWSFVIGHKVVEQANKIMSSIELLPPKKIYTKKIETQDVNSSLEIRVPKGYEEIPGRLTKSEIEKCFSFLYLEKSKDGLPFLSKEKVSYIFRYGIAIPESGKKVKRFKLNCSNAFPKSIINTAIYKFFRAYSESNNVKLDIVRFFANYIDDFHDCLYSQKKMRILAGNIHGVPPKTIKFDLDRYIPSPPTIVPAKIVQPSSKAQDSQT